MVFIILVLTGMPFNFRFPDSFRFFVIWDFKDLIANIFLFIPIGFLFRLSFRNKRELLFIKALLFGFLLSAAIEIMQVFIQGRYSSFNDILTNVSGLLPGFFLAEKWLQSLQEKENEGILFLEIPLMGVVYLLIPLQWMTVIAIQQGILRVLMHVLLSLCGLIIMISVSRKHPSFMQNRMGISNTLIYVFWYGVSVFPVIYSGHIYLVFTGVLLSLTMYLMTFNPHVPGSQDKRFELKTLRIMMPFFILYLCLIPFSEQNVRSYSSFMHLQDSNYMDVLYLLEKVGTFTLLGYLVSEMRSRKNETIKHHINILIAFGAVFSLIFILMNMWLNGRGIQMGSFVMLFISFVFGGWIYLRLARMFRRGI